MKNFITLSAFFFSLLILNAQNEKVKDLQNERQAILKDIQETQKMLDANTTTINNALSRLDMIDSNIRSHKKVITILNSEINSIDNSVSNKEKQIISLENDLQKRKESYATSLRKLYLNKKNIKDNLLFVLAADNFVQSMRRVEYLKDFSAWGKRQGEEIADKQKEIEKEKENLIKSRETKTTLLADRKTQEAKLLNEEQSKKKEIRSLEKNKQQLQTQLSKKKQQAEALNRQIELFIAEETLNASRKETSENRKAEVKGGYAMTPTEKSLSSNFEANRGRLPMPLKGKYRITSDFGVHQHKELSRVEVQNNGIDIETTAGNEARAVFDGVVTRVFILQGYNTSVIVRHGNYLTLYSNLESVSVRQGDKVKTGQSLGKIFTDKEKDNTATLHFEVWKEQKKMDPAGWLSK